MINKIYLDNESDTIYLSEIKGCVFTLYYMQQKQKYFALMCDVMSAKIIIKKLIDRGSMTEIGEL